MNPEAPHRRDCGKASSARRRRRIPRGFAFALTLGPFWLGAAEAQEPIPEEIIRLLLPDSTIRHLGYELDFREDLSRGTVVFTPGYAEAFWSVTRGGGRLRPVLVVLELERFVDRADALRWRNFDGPGDGDAVAAPMGERGFYTLSRDDGGAVCRVTVQQQSWVYRLLVTIEDVASTGSTHPDPCQEIAYELAWEISGRLRDPEALLEEGLPAEPDVSGFEAPEGIDATPHSPAESVAITVAIAVSILVAAGIAIALARSIIGAFAGALTAGGPPTTHEAAAGISNRIIGRAERVAALWPGRWGRGPSPSVVEEPSPEEEAAAEEAADEGEAASDARGDRGVSDAEDATHPPAEQDTEDAAEEDEAASDEAPALPPLFDPYDPSEPLLTNESGQYFDPYSGTWVSPERARQLIDDLTRDLADEDPEEWRGGTEDFESPADLEDDVAEPADAENDPGFFGGLWDHFSTDMKGIAAELTNAGRDVWRDPWILWDAAKDHAGEWWETGAGAVDLAGKALDAVREGLETAARDPEGTLEGAVELHREASIEAVQAVGRAGEWLSEAWEDAWKPGVLRETASETWADIVWGAGKAKETLSDPGSVYEGIKVLSGASDLGAAMEEGKSLPARIGHMGMAILAAHGALSGVKAAARGATRLIGKVRRAAARAVGWESAEDLARAEGRRRLEAVRRRAAELRRAEALRNGTAETETVDQLKQRLASQKRGPVVSAEDAARRQGYAEHLERRTATDHSTIRPGEPSDLQPAPGAKPDTGGYTPATERHIQQVADQHGVKVYTRPTNTPAKELLRKKLALPKPELLKNKTMSELDVLLVPGATLDDVGKVAHFKPVMPPQGSMSDEVYAALRDRFLQRAREYRDQAAWLAKHRDKVVIDGYLIRDVETGKWFTGDVDGFAIRGMHGETLPKALVDLVQRELIEGPADVMHGFHTEWNYNGLPRDAPGPTRVERFRRWVLRETHEAPASKFDVSETIDRKIRGSHAPGGEALVTYTGTEGMGAPDPTASYWHGGTDNPLITP